MKRSAFTLVELIVVVVIVTILLFLLPDVTPFSAFWAGIAIAGIFAVAALALCLKGLRILGLSLFAISIAIAAYNAPTIWLMNPDRYPVANLSYVARPLSHVLHDQAKRQVYGIPVEYRVEDTELANSIVTVDSSSTEDMQSFVASICKQLGCSSSWHWRSGSCGGTIGNPRIVRLYLFRPSSDSDSYDYHVFIDDQAIDDFSDLADDE